MKNRYDVFSTAKVIRVFFEASVIIDVVLVNAPYAVAGDHSSSSLRIKIQREIAERLFIYSFRCLGRKRLASSGVCSLRLLSSQRPASYA
jgi:hypothetical protein